MKPHFPMLAVALLSVSSAFAATSSSLSVVEFSPSPNYELTTDPKDMSQLTDGLELKPPLWTKSGGVGWSNKSPIAIRIRFLTSSTTNAGAGTLQLHAGKGTIAGVYLPVRYDIYSNLSPPQYTHVGEYQLTQADWPDSTSSWISIPVADHGSELFMVVHGDGSYIMLDELRWIPGAPTGNTSPSTSGTYTTPTAILNDSATRLNSTIRSAAQEDQRRILGLLPSKCGIAVQQPCLVWSMPAYTPDLNAFVTQNLAALSTTTSLIGTDQEKESFVLAVANKGLSAKTLQFSVDPAYVKAVSFATLDKVVSASGTQVYDPLLPMPTDTLTVDGQKISYVWVTADLTKFNLGSQSITITVKEGSHTYGNVNINATVIATPTPSKSVQAVAWSYSEDIPIWNNPQKNLDDLRSHRINMFTTNQVPPLTVSGTIPQRYIDRLLSDMRLFRGGSKILVFLGWPGWIDPSVLNLSPSRFESAVKNYISQVATAIAKAGFSYDEWALYPVDEPHGDSMAFLRKVAPMIKSANSSARIYANPITTTSGVSTLQDLRFLAPYIDYWQPDPRFARLQQSFFLGLNKDWWVYDVVAMPAKAQPPLKYRWISWTAWRLGASGTGAWAYSDTKKSSAWSDSDGLRPDWAVVYEGANGPASSRRWEAFRDGIEDFETLRVMNASSTTGKSYLDYLNQTIQGDTPPDWPAFEAVRMEALRRGFGVQ